LNLQVLEQQAVAGFGSPRPEPVQEQQEQEQPVVLLSAYEKLFATAPAEQPADKVLPLRVSIQQPPPIGGSESHRRTEEASAQSAEWRRRLLAQAQRTSPLTSHTASVGRGHELILRSPPSAGGSASTLSVERASGAMEGEGARGNARAQALAALELSVVSHNESHEEEQDDQPVVQLTDEERAQNARLEAQAARLKDLHGKPLTRGEEDEFGEVEHVPTNAWFRLQAAQPLRPRSPLRQPLSLTQEFAAAAAGLEEVGLEDEEEAQKSAGGGSGGGSGKGSRPDGALSPRQQHSAGLLLGRPPSSLTRRYHPPPPPPPARV